MASIVFTVLQLTSGEKASPSDLVALLGLPVATASLLVGLLALRRPVERDTAGLSRGWAATLATQVGAAEGRQWRQLLGDDTQRINLAFSLRAVPSRAADAPDAGRLFDGTPTVPDVAAYRHRTRPRRLVVTGAAGSGKTVLALELMLALLDGRGGDDPVPVRLSLSSWDTRTPLSGLLVRRLVEAYDWPSSMAVELVRLHRVLPVLDGLDEMDPTLPDGSPAPDAPRALAALRALNAYQEGRGAGPLVLTCRSAHYDALAARARLADAARVEIDAVPATDAHAFLLRRADDPARWRPVLDSLRDDPVGPLATALSTPWRLCLAVTVYARDHDPADLLALTTPDDLDAHLLARFIPAITDLHPAPYSAADTHRWLARLARHLAAHPSVGMPAGPGTDLALHRLWPLAGTTRVRWVDAALTSLVVTGPIVLLGEQIDTDRGQVFKLVSHCVYVAAAALTVFLTVRSRTDRPAGFDLTVLRTPAGLRPVRRALLASLPMGLMCGTVIWTMIALFNYVSWGYDNFSFFRDDSAPGVGFSLFGNEERRSLLVTWVVLGTFGGAALGLTRGIAAALRVQPTAAVAPRRIIRGEIVLGAALALLAAFSAMAGLTLDALSQAGLSAFYTTDGLDLEYLTMLLSFGFCAGLLAGLTRTAARRYLVFVLCSCGRLPLRLGVFLDHCCDTGLMRVSGSCYQFRHRELQHWLATHPDPATASTRPVDSLTHHT
ncbi:NACHT domain-containing protein [Kitasatospora griseola]|uniref:NACHT domain-containing protein n=1 Tax=Kitasatospora griseola TaxID=2064 RepID=UPI003816C282